MILKKRNTKQTQHSHHVQKRWGCLIIFMAWQPSSIPILKKWEIMQVGRAVEYNNLLLHAPLKSRAQVHV